MCSVLKNYIRHHSLIIGMYDVITIGSAARDVFVKSKALKVLRAPMFATGRAIGISLGSKLAIDELNFFVGGGAVNTAATFARQGLRTAAFTTIGHDPGGKAVEVSGTYTSANTAPYFLVAIPGQEIAVLGEE